MYYHAKSGLYFTRLPNGNVEIIKTSDNKVMDKDNILFTQEIDFHMWASIIAYVSSEGETSHKYYDAIKFHNNPNAN